MAKKEGFIQLHAAFLICITLAGVVGAGLMVFQQLCLKHPNNTFLSGGTCMSDSHSRALLAAAFTVMTAIMSQSIGKAAVAFRTASLSTGVPEGVYIALGTNALGSKYIAEAMKHGRAWAMPIVLMMLAAHSQNFVQALANLGIQVSQVYVQNTGTAIVYDAASFYNSSSMSFEDLFPDLSVAIPLLTKMQQYRLSSFSTLSKAGAVVTNVLRANYLTVFNQTVNDDSNAFRHEEVVATVVTKCGFSEYRGPAGKLFTNTSVAFNTSYSPLVGLYVYDVGYRATAPNALQIESSFIEAECVATAADSCKPFLSSTPVKGVIAECDSNLTLTVSDIIYAVATEYVQITGFQSNETTVPLENFAELLLAYATSPEGVAGFLQSVPYSEALTEIISDFPTGLFVNFNEQNYIHTKLCAAASASLDLLWNAYGHTTAAGYQGNVSLDGLVGNAYALHDRRLPLYTLVIQTYVSTVSMALIVGTLVGAAWIICSVGMIFAQRAVINLKTPSDTSLLYNVDEAVLSRKRHTVGASNDPDLQCRMSFDPSALLFCREADSTSVSAGGRLVTGKRVAVFYGTKTTPPPGAVPNTRYDYW